ncbi:MAG: hypothetical protein MZV63_15050 [Marinilabiliales bacterium]|nr:hypothetical protein [Marinilabiliales bacterium]
MHRLHANFGAKGIGLCRTEHMFFEGDRIKAMREMILADDEAGRRKALDKLLPIQRERLRRHLGSHARLPGNHPPARPATARICSSRRSQPEGNGQGNGHCRRRRSKQKVDELHELNPMLGHRGCRLGNHLS